MARVRWFIVSFLVGLTLIAAAFWHGVDWQSIAVEVGVALALVGVLAAIEDDFRRKTVTRLTQTERRVDTVEVELSTVADAVRRAEERRTGSLEAAVHEFKSNPTPEGLWKLHEWCERLRLETDAQIRLGPNGLIVAKASSPSLAYISVQRAASLPGLGSPPDPVEWRQDADLATVIGSVQDALAMLGTAADPSGLFDAIGGSVRRANI